RGGGVVARGVGRGPVAVARGGGGDRLGGRGVFGARVGAPRGGAGAGGVGAVGGIGGLPLGFPAVWVPTVWVPVLQLPAPGELPLPLPVPRVSALWFLATAGASAVRRHRTTQPDWVRAPAGPPSADASRPGPGGGPPGGAAPPHP